ncbi:MAG: Protein translocase subunit SecE [Microgenomates bacterium OLB22]|nr:MAG: Protein translocase subunit SecE [Microgenomates bacterium OLB22]
MPQLVLFSGIQDELKKVTWPTRQTTLYLTIVVITLSLIVGLYVGIIDILMAMFLQAIANF